MKRIGVVYYGFINPKVDWWNIIGGQLAQIKNSGILNVADLYVHLTNEDEHILFSAIDKVKILLPEAIISSSVENRFEYPAIHLLWTLAKSNPEKIYLYFHSKGITHGSNERLLHEKQLFAGTILPYEKVLKIFDTYEHINKVGLFPSEKGWIWFNFWWVRGKYVVECEEPIITERRHYYEDWIHRKLPDYPKSSFNECYSLIDDKHNVFHTPHEACSKLGSIRIKESNRKWKRRR